MSRFDLRQQGKRLLGGVPFAAELHQSWISPGAPVGGYDLERLESLLPSWVEASEAARVQFAQPSPCRLLVVGYLKWWLEYACALATLLTGLGHRVDLAFLPYRRWDQPILTYDLRRQRRYLRARLAGITSHCDLYDLSARNGKNLPAELVQRIRLLSQTDVQYTFLRETIDLQNPSADRDLFELRLDRNQTAAANAFELIQRDGYDAVVVPNGSILEFGAVYQAARVLNTRVVTYEFGEQRGRIWLAQDDQVMRQDTHDLWEQRGGTRLTEDEQVLVRELLQARRGGRLWEHFGRQWQRSKQAGSSLVAKRLGLDPAKSVVLLCTNVVGDSLALGREIFTQGMAEWLALTVRFFSQRPEAQLVVRVHPGEMLGAGHPSVEIIQEEFIQHPENLLVVPPESDINTYDLIELAEVGLVYTSTVGLEMALAGIPVVVSGQTHYRGKGFTRDPHSKEGYLEVLDALLTTPQDRRLKEEQIELAWRYAHRFFFEYPFTFPWHLVHFWSDIEDLPMGEVLKPEVLASYQRSLDALVGRPFEWGSNRD